MPIKVSVIVPVYNPGRHMDDLIASLLRQSLPTDEFEAVFVDDGSTDGTGERLDALAAEHPNISCLHIPNSGWPGRPRNVGLEAAQGEYVYFVDNDDYLGDEALERLYDFAQQHGSDVVVGKVVGRGRVIPREIFRKNVERTNLRAGFPLTLLTPHKLFRRSLLMEHGLRYPEGRRRLEDHLFVMAVYFKAEVLSILADYACYYWVKRDDTTNASSSRFDPVGYFDNMREVLDLVAESAEPGAYRDRLLGHWYRGKVLGRMGRGVLFSYPPDYRAGLHAELRRLVREDRWGEGVHAGLSMSLRVRSRLLRDAGLEELERLAEVEKRMKTEVSMQEATPMTRGRLRFRVDCRPRYADGSPVLFRRTGTSLSWVLPPELADLEELTAGDRDVTRALLKAKATGIVRSVEDKSEYVLSSRSTVTEQHEGDDLVSILVVTDLTVDPATAAAGSPLPLGDWEVVSRLSACGWDRFGHVPAGDAPRIGVATASPPRSVVAGPQADSRRLVLSVSESSQLPPDVVVVEPAPVVAGAGSGAAPPLVTALRSTAGRRVRAIVRHSPALTRTAAGLRAWRRRARG